MSEVVVDQLRKHPVLAPFCTPLPRLIEPDNPDLARSVNRFGELIGSRPEPVSLGFRITGSAARFWRLKLDREGFTVTEEPADEDEPADNEDSAQSEVSAPVPPDVEVITGEGTWRRIAGGEVSPMAAMLAGELRFRGDVVAAGRVVHQLRRNGARSNGKGL
jgi:putative sterol carrier protein